MIVTVSTDICAGYPTAAGNIYTEPALKELCARKFLPDEVPGKLFSFRIFEGLGYSTIGALVDAARRNPQFHLVECSVFNGLLFCDLEIADNEFIEHPELYNARIVFEDREVTDDRKVNKIGKVLAVFLGDYSEHQEDSDSAVGRQS